jgi:hypothetical protein
MQGDTGSNESDSAYQMRPDIHGFHVQTAEQPA